MSLIKTINWVDGRGSFMKFDELFTPAEICFSSNPTVGTLRGLHYEIGEGARSKVVYCVRGKVWDVAVKVATGACGIHMLEPGDGAHWSEGMAHGFITLEPDTELLYLMSKKYRPECARGLRWDDEALIIPWPMRPNVISERDRNFPDWRAP